MHSAQYVLVLLHQIQLHNAKELDASFVCICQIAYYLTVVPVIHLNSLEKLVCAVLVPHSTADSKTCNMVSLKRFEIFGFNCFNFILRSLVLLSDSPILFSVRNMAALRVLGSYKGYSINMVDYFEFCS